MLARLAFYRVARPLYASRRVTYLMVLDGEEDEATRVLLEERLVGVVVLDNSGLSLLLLDLLDLLDDWLVVGIDLLSKSGDSRVRVVLLVRDAEIELLNGRLHLEGVNGSSGLL